MDTRKVFLRISLLLLFLFLVACTPLPRGARDAVLAPFPPEEEPRLLSAHKARLLPEDVATGVEEVWCVEVAYRCWSCPHGKWRTCVSGYLVRRAGEEWRSVEMRTEGEWAGWEARGCPVVPEAP